MKTSSHLRALALMFGCAFAAPPLADEPQTVLVPVAPAIPAATAVPVAPVAPAAPAATAVPVTTVAPAAPVTKAVPYVLVEPSVKSAPAKTMVKPLVLTVQLTNGTTLNGNLLDATTLNMKTSFGDAVIPLSEVAGVKMAQEANPVTTVVMLNGDSITGAADVSRVDIQTEWGKVEINGPNVSSLLFAQGLKWVSTAGLNGSRWTLAADSPNKAPPATAKATPTPAPAPTPILIPTPAPTPVPATTAVPMTRSSFFGR